MTTSRSQQRPSLHVHWGLPMLSAVLLLTIASCAQRHEPPQTWVDTTGRAHRVLATSDNAATVLLFIAIDCPIANAYAPEIARLVSDYKDAGVRFFAVHS